MDRTLQALYGSTIDVFAVTNLVDSHFMLLIVDFIDDAEIALANSIARFVSGELFGTTRSWVICQTLDLPDDALAVGL